MCELCEKTKNNAQYKALVSKMHMADSERLENTKKAAASFSSILAYSTMEYPIRLIEPMFELKIAFATPMNYFQNLFVNGERQPANFSHGATRSLFFSGKRLVLLSKSVAAYEGREIFSSFLLAHFEQGEYSMDINPENRIAISANAQKPAKNLLGGNVEKINIEFNFVQESLGGKLIGKNEALASTLFVNQFKRSGMDARAWLTSTEYMFDYVSSAAHFSPHPYMLRFCKELGYANQRDFQMHAADYFRAHV